MNNPQYYEHNPIQITTLALKILKLINKENSDFSECSMEDYIIAFFLLGIIIFNMVNCNEVEDCGNDIRDCIETWIDTAADIFVECSDMIYKDDEQTIN